MMLVAKRLCGGGVRTVSRCIVCLFLTAVTAAPNVFAAPKNDAFVDATLLFRVSGRIESTNVDATSEAGEPLHAGERSHSVWWRWTAPDSGSLSVNTFGSGFDTTLAVYRGDSITSLARLGEDDDDPLGVPYSLVDVDVQKGTTYRIAVDGFEQSQGSIRLTWWFERSGERPLNDVFDSAIPIEAERGELLASSVGATAEPGEPDHVGVPGGASVWWRWRAPRDGIASVETAGSTFDTLLAIYTGSRVSALQPIAADDDGVLRASATVFRVTADTLYHIAVDGYDGSSGMIALRWQIEAPCRPELPRAPIPPVGSEGVQRDVTLRWDGSTMLRQAVVYGDDDRFDLYQVEDPSLVAAAASTAALVLRDNLVDNGDGTYTLSGLSLANADGLCPGEPFGDQPTPAFCSGFLVAPQIIATAGHCIDLDCARVAVVFGFQMLDARTPVTVVPASDVYFCSDLIGRETQTDFDWGLWVLDRAVADRDPLRIRRQGQVRRGQELVMIGYPSGLPVKVAGGASVRSLSGSDAFIANLDAFQGNSGSAVFDRQTLIIEGILYAGEEDYVDSGECQRVNRCSDTGCEGELVASTVRFADLIPAHEESLSDVVHFGKCGELVAVGTTSDRSWTVSDLDVGEEYCWRVVRSDDCGDIEGPLWRFRVTDVETPMFRRGDADANGGKDLSDGVSVLNFLFRGQPEAVPCPKAADSDDDGVVNLADAMAILLHLFRGGPAPAPPYDACGNDPTPDDLECSSFAACEG